MRTTVLGLLLLSASTSYVAGNEQCLAQNIEKCVTTVRKLYGREEMVVTQDDIVLNALCRHTQEAMKCIDQYVERCMDNSHRMIYRDLTAGLVVFVREFCDEKSEFSREYRKHLPCYNNLTEEFRNCSSYMSQAKEEVETLKLRSTEAIHTLCCNYDRMTSCFRLSVVRSNCSLPAADFVQVIFEKLFGNFTRKLSCDDYQYSDSTCSSQASSTYTPSLAIFGLYFLWYMWNRSTHTAPLVASRATLRKDRFLCREQS